MDDQNSRTSKPLRDLHFRRESQTMSNTNDLSFVDGQNSLRRQSTLTSDNCLQETPKRQKLSDSVNGIINISDSDSIPGSPWEWRKMKGEVIAMKTRLNHQEGTIQQLHKVRQEMEEMFHKEKKILEIQIDENKEIIRQLELRVDVGKRKLLEAKNAQAKAEHDLIAMKSKMERKILTLVDDNTKLTEQLRQYIRQDTKPDVNSINLANNKMLGDMKNEIINKRIVELEEKLKEARAIQQKYEMQCIEVQTLKVKVENFEAEKSIFQENKNFFNRTAKVSELEKELSQAREIIKSLRESVKGKLLLEEQMVTAEHRLERTEKLEKQVSQLEITQGELLFKIAEYESIGISGGPLALRREISRLQKAEILLTAEEGQLRSKIDSLEKELLLSQQKHEETKKLLADTSNSHERLTRFIGRLQKKTSLVTRERDSYRQQLDSYEKEIIGSQSGENTNISNERIPALERAIEGYRDLVTKLESELESCDGGRQKEECKKLQDEIDKLKGELEHRALKGDFNINTRILHYKFNPAALAEQLAEEKQKALIQEVEQLRAIVASGSHSGVAPISSVQAQEIEELKQKNELKITRLKEAFKASSHEYRQACYQLFGWRVDRTKEGQYKLSSQYAESPDDYLFFIVNEEGVNMIETPFSATLSVFIERHLAQQQSVPMFLNAVQSDLFDQQTVTTLISKQ